MKIISFLIIMLVCNICVAGEKYTCTEHGCIDYSHCRQDFAVKLCKANPKDFQCLKFEKSGQPYVTWEEAFKNEKLRLLVQKINRRNTLIWRNHCIAMPYDYFSKDEIDFAPFNKKMFSQSVSGLENNKTIIVDLKQLAWGAYLGNNLIKWGPANGGMGRCKETGKMTCKTPVGTWKVYELKPGFQRSDLYPVDCKDKKVCGHPYFNVVKFGPHYEALHGERDGHVPGANVSHGCVRVFKTDSKWLINFAEKGTTVIVFDY